MAEFKTLEDAITEVNRLKKQVVEQQQLIDDQNEHIAQAESAKKAGKPVIKVGKSQYYVNVPKVRLDEATQQLVPAGLVNNSVIEIAELIKSGDTRYFEHLIANKSGILTPVKA